MGSGDGSKSWQGHLKGMPFLIEFLLMNQWEHNFQNLHNFQHLALSIRLGGLVIPLMVTDIFFQ